jgi:Cft2 family RNA processing exonuclease
LLLDVGIGPDIGQVPNLDGIGRVDAVLLSHAHGDHAGGLHLLAQVGNPPVYATDIVAAQISGPDGRPVRSLPLRGQADVLGVTITTGRNGHSPGGVWLHLDVGDGFLYAGDTCVESEIYAFDEPPPAATAVVDASDGFYDQPQIACRDALRQVLVGRPALLPVPATGRGPEIALFVLDEMGLTPALCGDLRGTIERMVGSWRGALRPEAADRLARLLFAARPIDEVPEGITIATNANGNRGVSECLLSLWRDRDEVAVVLTGYVPHGTPAKAAELSGRAAVLRWNVHPRLSDNIKLLRSVKARTVVPAFVTIGSISIWETALSPVHVAFGPLFL